ncbi:MAG: BrnA antitoxin family protein [Rhodoferax sp.]|nr:BrnA antitoxin family protein [Rhodoferax sp.]MBP9683844.1 BrnA antitoxin family protein [Rhodoferax sp.]
MAEFEAALLRSMDQAASGEGRVTTPTQILARRAGRPVGTVKAVPKVSTTIRLSADVVQAFRAAGDGWQTRIDAALKDWLRTHSPV